MYSLLIFQYKKLSNSYIKYVYIFTLKCKVIVCVLRLFLQTRNSLSEFSQFSKYELRFGYNTRRVQFTFLPNCPKSAYDDEWLLRVP